MTQILAGFAVSNAEPAAVSKGCRDVMARKASSGLPRATADAVEAMTVPDAAAVDRALLAGAAQGKPVAFRGLIDRHLPAVVAIARRMLRDDTEAEDIAQEAFLRLWRNAATIEIGPGGARPWLRRVVSNLCIDRIRSARNTSVVAEVPETAEPASQDRTLEEAELSGRVDAALQALPERQRLALVLFHYEGMSQVEVGEVLGVTDEAVESLLARARRTLKAGLKNEWQSLLPGPSG